MFASPMRFELFYLNYAVGTFLASVLAAGTLGLRRGATGPCVLLEDSLHDAWKPAVALSLAVKLVVLQ